MCSESDGHKYSRKNSRFCQFWEEKYSKEELAVAAKAGEQAIVFQ